MLFHHPFHCLLMIMLLLLLQARDWIDRKRSNQYFAFKVYICFQSINPNCFSFFLYINSWVNKHIFASNALQFELSWSKCFQRNTCILSIKYNAFPDYCFSARISYTYICTFFPFLNMGVSIDEWGSDDLLFTIGFAFPFGLESGQDNDLFHSFRICNHKCTSSKVVPEQDWWFVFLIRKQSSCSVQ